MAVENGGCLFKSRSVRAREASENVIWWLQQKRIVERIVYGFFSSGLRYMEDQRLIVRGHLQGQSVSQERANVCNGWRRRQRDS